MSSLEGCDKRILVQRQIGYVLGERAMLFTSKAAEPLYLAVDENQIEDAFHRLGIGAVVPYENSNETAVSVLPWYDYVVKNPKIIVNGFEVYFLE